MLIIIEITIRGWDLLSNADLTALLILALITELGWNPSVRPR